MPDRCGVHTWWTWRNRPARRGDVQDLCFFFSEVWQEREVAKRLLATALVTKRYDSVFIQQLE